MEIKFFLYLIKKHKLSENIFDFVNISRNKQKTFFYFSPHINDYCLKMLQDAGETAIIYKLNFQNRLWLFVITPQTNSYPSTS